MGDLGSILGLGRSPGEGKGYPLQYSGLENSMDCIDHGVTKSQTQLSDLHFHFHKEQEGGASDLHVPPAGSKSWVCLNPSVPTLPHLSDKMGQVIISFLSFSILFLAVLCPSCGSRSYLQLWPGGPVALWHVGYYFPDQGLNLCPLDCNHWTPREVPCHDF